MKTSWHTAWQGQDIVVFRDDAEVDRFSAAQIERVTFVHRGRGDSPGDLLFAVVDLPDQTLLLPDYTGFAGRVNFERQAFWADRGCVFWVTEARATLPLRLKRGRWLLRSAGPAFQRLPRAELAAWTDKWPVQGPQTWEQRKWRRIGDSRPFSTSTTAAADSRLRA